MRRRVGALLALTLALTACASDEPSDAPDDGPTLTQSPAPSSSSAPPSSAPSSAAPDAGPPRVVGTAATGLAVPWGIDFLPSGEAVVTERDSGRVLLLDGEGGVQEITSVDVAGEGGEGGLLGVAVSPDFAQDRSVFLYATTATDNRVLRLRLDGTTAAGTPEVVLEGIPAGFTHDGGRLEFGPDGFLYVSTGETGDRALAQDRDSLAGKILRITPDGDPAPGNPFDSPVLSWGHRNVQGLAFDDQNRLWASEFGDASWDELNLIEPGSNYGWPEVEGEGGGGDFVDPQAVWPVEQASPSGLAYADGSLWMAGLRGGRLWQIPLEGGRAGTPQDFLTGEYGRLRAVVRAPDGRLWVSTSNQDGRGDPGPEDDRILILQP